MDCKAAGVVSLV